ncbi:hypothetical protein SEA_GOIB_4 [Gordonia phage Goib]|nr:hypothetical protein SEA_GOIB_4 [Gordonia phage Goib]
MNNTNARRARAARIHDARMSNTFAMVTDSRETAAAEQAQRDADARVIAEARANMVTLDDATDLEEFFAQFD